MFAKNTGIGQLFSKIIEAAADGRQTGLPPFAIAPGHTHEQAR